MVIYPAKYHRSNERFHRLSLNSEFCRATSQGYIPYYYITGPGIVMSNDVVINMCLVTLLGQWAYITMMIQEGRCMMLYFIIYNRNFVLYNVIINYH